MNKLTKVISGVWVFCFFSLPAISQNVAVIDTQAAILQTQVAQDAFKALEEETEYSSMVEEAKELGYQEFQLDVLSDNPAVGFYRSLGLEVLAETKAPKPAEFGVPIEFRMGKLLN